MSRTKAAQPQENRDPSDAAKRAAGESSAAKTSLDPLAKSDRYRLVTPFSPSARDLGEKHRGREVVSGTAEAVN